MTDPLKQISDTSPEFACRRTFSRVCVFQSASFFRLLALTIATTLFAAPLFAQETARARELGKKLMCVCGCNQVLISCNHVGCSYSHDMIKQLNERVARNEPDDLTIQAFVQEYGPTVLSAPPAKGFNRAAWIMPVIVPLIALGIFWEVIRRWRLRSAFVAASGPKISADLLARAQREAQKESDE